MARDEASPAGYDDVGAAGVPQASGLYTTSRLLGAWDRGDPLSYARTLDAMVFRASAALGLRVPSTEIAARDRALHDHVVTRALDAAIDGSRVVAFMGGHQLQRTSEAYVLVAEAARSLTAKGFLVVTGGGPGAMEAAHLGARLSTAPEDDLARALAELATEATFPSYQQAQFLRADGEFDAELLERLHAWQAPAFAVAERWPDETAGVSIGIPTWLYGHEPPTPLATAHAKYFENSIREDGLLAIAGAGVVFAEGSAGTLQEVFQDAAQNFYASVNGTRSPMVFIDLDECWSVRRPVKLLLEGLFDEETERLLHFVTTAAAVVTAISS